MAYSLDRNKGKVSDIKNNIDIKQGELKNLEKNKQSLIDAGMEIKGSQIDEDVQKTLLNEINSALEANAEKGKELASDMNADARDLEDLKQETQESMQSNQEQRKSLEKKKASLDIFGLGNKMDDALSELDDNKTQLEDFNKSLIETSQELDKISQLLNSL
ncbi:MAG: hypothetical protein MR936_09595 [Eubacterium sp.]|nr:hypothetical protein [Eubacterium sp.]